MKNATLWIILAIVSYVIGVGFLPNTNEYNKRETYTYVDSEGEEHEDYAPLEVENVGRVLTFRDVYFSVVGLVLVGLIIGRIAIGEDKEILGVLILNSIVGIILLFYWNKSTTLSILFYWIGIILASIGYNKGK